jgi:hypothetical protein
MSSGLSEEDINRYFSVQELRNAVKQYGYDTSALFGGYTRLTKAQLIKLIINQGMHFQLANDLGVIKGNKKLDIKVGGARELPTRIKEGMSGDYKSKEELGKKSKELESKKEKAVPKLDYRLTMAKGKIPNSEVMAKRNMGKQQKANYARLTMVQSKLSPAESAMNRRERGKFDKNLTASESKYQKQREQQESKQQGQALEQQMLVSAGGKTGVPKKKQKEVDQGKSM